MSTAGEQLTAPMDSSPACSLAVSAAGGSPPSPTAVPDPVCRGVFAAPLYSAAAQAGPQGFCWASAPGDRGGLSLAPGACELTAGERTSGTVSASDHRGGDSPMDRTPSLPVPPSQQWFPSGDVPCSRAGQRSSTAQQVERHHDMVLSPGSAGGLVCLLSGKARAVPVAWGGRFLTVRRSELLWAVPACWAPGWCSGPCGWGPCPGRQLGGPGEGCLEPQAAPLPCLVLGSQWIMQPRMFSSFCSGTSGG